jgi:Flp pilus assembly protein CpaB
MRYPLQLIALVIALIAVSSCFHTGPRNTNVIVAARDLKVGTTIAATDIDIIQIDPSVAPKSVPRLRSEVLGHEVLHPISKGEVILPSELSAEAKVR